MGTAGVELFDVGAAVSDLAHVMEWGQRRPEPFPDVRRRLAQPHGILEKHDSNHHERGLRGPGLDPGFTSPALHPGDVTAIIAKVISLSTGQ
jgi:hypothetical protein